MVVLSRDRRGSEGKVGCILKRPSELVILSPAKADQKMA